IYEAPEAVAAAADGILLTSADGRVHFDQFQRVVAAGKPIFVDKPFALETETARKMFQIADQHNVPLMSASSLRFTDEFVEKIADGAAGSLFGADFFGPMMLEETQPGFFWYGIHAVEMLFASMGAGCIEVRSVANDDHDFVTGIWNNGRIGTVRGNRCGNN